MSRFVSFLWDPADGTAAMEAAAFATALSSISSEWTRAEDAAGTVTLQADTLGGPAQRLVLPDAGGVLLGRLFRNSGMTGDARRLQTVSSVESRAIVASAGARLVERYWGGYVAVLHEPAAHRHFILRDVSGRLPCFMTRCGRLIVVFSDLADVLDLGCLAPSTNWKYVAAFLADSDMRARDCGIEGVTEVLAGERVTLSGAGLEASSRDFAWHPAAFYPDEPADGFEAAAATLRDAVQRCIDAWSTEYRAILHQLSGGLDSAIVLGCLTRSPSRPSVTCLNRYTPRTGEDERAFARLAAALAGVELAEYEWECGPGDLAAVLRSAPLAPKPNVMDLSWLDAELFEDLVRHFGAEAIWSGQGGDHLFLVERTSVMAADYRQHHGWEFASRRVIKDAARLSGASYLTVLRSMYFPPASPPTRSIFLAPEIEMSLTRATWAHPWLSDCSRLPPGKQSQIQGLSDFLNRPWPMARALRAEQIHPLLSQPIIECCLRIPTYVLSQGGRDRALARHTFRDRVPAEILERESKGATTTYIVALLRQNVRYIRELLLDGELAQHGLLNRRALEHHLSAGQPLRAEQTMPLLACLVAEAWRQRWMQHAARANARTAGHPTDLTLRDAEARTETTARCAGTPSSDELAES
jgi:asparagine synthase (glutamine-hydrolysing)